MCALSGSGRRATQDIDLDFVRYPMTDASIRSFVSALSNLGDGVTVRIAGEIEELSQQDYKGRRVNLKVSDGRRTFDTKLDLGVHASAAMSRTSCGSTWHTGRRASACLRTRKSRCSPRSSSPCCAAASERPRKLVSWSVSWKIPPI